MTELIPQLANTGAFGLIAIVIVYLFARVHRLEGRFDEVEQRASRLAVLHERALSAYERARDDLLLCLRVLRAKESMSTTQLDAIEQRSQPRERLIGDPAK